MESFGVLGIMDLLVLAMLIAVTVVAISRTNLLNDYYSKMIHDHKKSVTNYEESKIHDSENDEHFNTVQWKIGFYEAKKKDNKTQRNWIVFSTISTIIIVIMLTLCGFQEYRLLAASVILSLVFTVLAIMDIVWKRCPKST